MSSRFLIIDGYNLMHAAGLARARYGPGDLQRQRHRLLVRLTSALTAEERIRCTVVFDAIEAPSGLAQRFRHGEITVMFAEPGHEADELIEALIAGHSAARQLLIVSSDHRLQKAAKQRRAESVDSEVFLERLSARAKSNPPKDAGTGRPTAGSAPGQTDIGYWMDEFGDIDVETLAKSDDPDAQSKSIDPWQKNVDELQRRLNNIQDLDDWLNERPGQERKPD
jgi:hypothetical protein